MVITPLSNQDRIAFEADFVVQIEAADLTETTTNTAQAITLFTAPAGYQPIYKGRYLETPFEDASDAAFNSLTVSYGDAGSATRYQAAVQANVNGTEVLYSPASATQYLATSDTAVLATVGSMTGKSLANIDVGTEISLWKLVPIPTLQKVFK
jgi:hypothetical protein